MANTLTIALPKGRLASDTFQRMEQAGYLISLDNNKRKLIVEDKTNNFRYLFVKPSDVLTYVEEGVADLGVVGKDLIMEESKDVYQLLDLEIGRCKMVIAGRPDGNPLSGSSLRVATKFPNVARKYLAKRFGQLHIVPLQGSVELGPLVGLADVIVDIYETGNTLKANGLERYEDLFDISAYLVANKASYRLNASAIQTIKERLSKRGD